jgi:hypothetical protein
MASRVREIKEIRCMKKTIITTTINSPTDAIRKYDSLGTWNLIVTGDVITPKYELKNGRFMSWDEQVSSYKDLCDIIGPCSVARGRMIAALEAYKCGAEVIATIDDDCDPMSHWGWFHVGMETHALLRIPANGLCLDPIYGYWDGWHRGFPIQLIADRDFKTAGKNKMLPLIQADFSNGQGDFDAAWRLGGAPWVNYNKGDIFYTDKFSPFNTQNTFVHRSAMNDYFWNIPFIGRMDDIWAAYIFEAYHPQSVIYHPATTFHYQNRSIDSIVRDLEQEIFGYKNTLGFLECINASGVENAMNEFLPKKSIEAISCYRNHLAR